MSDTNATPDNIAAPADAKHVSGWVNEGDLGLPGRWFLGTERNVAGVRVAISGWQESNGPTQRHIGVTADAHELDAAAARALAAALRDAADELDQLERRSMTEQHDDMPTSPPLRA
jgi:hypothetical protein